MRRAVAAQLTSRSRAEHPPIGWLPFVVPLADVYTAWATAQIDLAWLPRPMAATIVGVALVTLVARALLGRVLGTAVATAITASLATPDLRITGLLVALCIVVAASLRLTVVDRTPLVRRVLHGYRVAAVAMVAITFATSIANGSMPAAVTALRDDLALAPPGTPVRLDLPDIWIVLLDGYPGDDALAEIDPAYDAGALPSELASLGFEVQARSRTSYPLTRLVLPSMFNGQHVAALVGTGGDGADLAVLTRRLRTSLEESAVLRILGTAGYERVGIASGWAEVGPRRVDRHIEPPQVTEFEVGLLRGTAIGGLLSLVAPDVNSQQLRDRIDTTFDLAAGLAAEPHTAPRFVFVHVPAPHLPVVFGPDGEAVNGSPGASVATAHDPAMPRPERIRRQLGELPYINERALGLLRGILDGSSRPTAIVVFSDHGTDVDWDANRPLKGGINERSSNLLAVRTPGLSGVMPAGTTTVNILVRLLGAYGIADLPVEPDGTWFYRSPANILDLVRVDPLTGRATP